MTVKAKKRRELRSFRLVIAASAALTVVFLAWVGLGVGGNTVTELTSDIVQAAAALAAAWACFNAANRNPYGFGRAWTASLHRAWRLLGSAALAWGLGQVIWTVLDLRHAEPRVPSLPDVGFLTAVPLLIAGVLAFPTAPMRATARLRTLLDGLLIAASLLFLGWATVLGGAFQGNTATTPLERAICMAYPLGDIVAGTIVLVLLTLIGPGYWSVILIMAAFEWPTFARLAYLLLEPGSTAGAAWLTRVDGGPGHSLLVAQALDAVRFAPDPDRLLLAEARRPGASRGGISVFDLSTGSAHQIADRGWMPRWVP